VLVVDDDADTRALVVAILAESGIQAVAAPDGESALRLLDERQVGLVLLDMTMPGMSGLDVLAVIRGRAETRILPVIVVTALETVEDRVGALEAGATDFLTKPVDPKELVARVRAHSRARAEWLRVLEEHAHWRGDVANMLSRIRPGAGAEATALEICETLGRLPDSVGTAIYSLPDPGVAVLLAGFGPPADVGPPGRALPAETARRLAERAGEWPSVERAEERDTGSPRGAGRATIYASLGDTTRPLGLLVLAFDRPAPDEPGGIPKQMVSAAFEFAAIATALLRPSLDERARSRAESGRVDDILRDRAFHTVFQPVVDLKAGVIVGYEALTRFEDGVPPDIRLAEATAVGRRADLDVAMMEAAVRAAARLPDSTWLGLNVSPGVILDSQRIEGVLGRSDRPMVLEVTEYERIDDYRTLADAVRRLTPTVRLAVDDAGAGYASLRHVLMLRPDFVKLDQEWIRGIEADAARQALIGALVLFAKRTRSVLIAEGIETAAELETLHSLGVKLGQGYFLGRPS
jgi:EAL domain-containing protein (putative c-di-GMP-specific phosphodiesterase class I)/DNA-binding response OmpR family regulator